MPVTRSLFILLILTSVAAAADSIKFELQPVKKGAVRTVDEKFSMDLTIEVSVNGQVIQKANQKMAKNENRKDPALEINKEGMPSKLKTQYIEVSEEANGVSKPAPHKGKTYIVTDDDKSVKVTDEQGQPVNGGESQAVSADFKDLGEVDKMSKFFNGKTVKVGEEVKVPDELARELMGAGQDDKMKVKKITFKLAKATSEAGTFDVEIVFEGQPAPGMNMNMTLTGTMSVTAGCWPAEAELKGSVNMKGGQATPNGKLDMKGNGPVTIKMKHTYE